MAAYPDVGPFTQCWSDVGRRWPNIVSTLRQCGVFAE